MKMDWVRMVVKLLIVWMMSVVQSFHIIVLINQIIFELAQFNSMWAYDPL